jgi:hypothetical protein
MSGPIHQQPQGYGFVGSNRLENAILLSIFDLSSSSYVPPGQAGYPLRPTGPGMAPQQGKNKYKIVILFIIWKIFRMNLVLIMNC